MIARRSDRQKGERRPSINGDTAAQHTRAGMTGHASRDVEYDGTVELFKLIVCFDSMYCKFCNGNSPQCACLIRCKRYHS